MLDLIFQYQDAYLRGILGTLKLACLTWIIGITIGGFLGAASYFNSNILSKSIRVLNYLVSSLPVIVVLFWFHYPAQAVLQLSIDPFYTALFVLSLINILAISVVVEHGFLQINQGYLEVAKSYGIPEKAIAGKILIPMVIRNILPAVLTSQMTILHMTIFASLISYEELFRVSQQINSVVYKPVEVYTILALFFIVISLPFILLTKKIKGNATFKDDYNA
jgi:ABC-type amino acid transport system permease subunit